MFSSSKHLTAPPVELPVGAPVEPISALVENIESRRMGEIDGEQWFLGCGDTRSLLKLILRGENEGKAGESAQGGVLITLFGYFR